MRVVAKKLKDHEAEACGVCVSGLIKLAKKLKDHEAEACGVCVERLVK